MERQQKQKLEVKELRAKNTQLKRKAIQLEMKVAEQERYKMKWKLRQNWIKEGNTSDNSGESPPTLEGENGLHSVHHLGPASLIIPDRSTCSLPEGELWRSIKQDFSDVN